MEIYKTLKNYPSYAVSNKGNIKSLNYNNTGKAKTLNPTINKAGYKTVMIQGKRLKVSRLVASEFLGLDISNRLIYVDHISGNTIGVLGKLDDSLENLRLVNPRDNRINYTSNRRALPHHISKNRTHYKVEFSYGSNSDRCRIYS